MKTGIFDAEETLALKQAYDRVMAVVEVDPTQEPEVARRIGRTLVKVFKAFGMMPVDDLAYATMLQITADSAPT